MHGWIDLGRALKWLGESIQCSATRDLFSGSCSTVDMHQVGDVLEYLLYNNRRSFALLHNAIAEQQHHRQRRHHSQSDYSSDYSPERTHSRSCSPCFKAALHSDPDLERVAEVPEAACTPVVNASTHPIAMTQDTLGERERPEPPQVSAGPKGASRAAHVVSSAQDITVFSGQHVLWSGQVMSEPSHCAATVVIPPIAVAAPEEEGLDQSFQSLSTEEDSFA